MMYLFWWSKPFDVQCSIVIRTKKLEKLLVEKAEQDRQSWTFPNRSNFQLSTYQRSLFNPLRNDFNHPERCVWTIARSSLHSLTRRLNGYQFLSKMCATLTNGQSDEESEELLVPQGPVDWNRIHCEGLANKLFHLVYLLMILPMDSILKPRDLQDIDDATKVIQTKRALHLLFNETCIRWIMSIIFYSEDSETRSFLFLFSALVGAGFGSIHFFAWHIDFPSSAERILWRTASLCIIGAFSASSQELLCINISGEIGTHINLKPSGMLVNHFPFHLLFILFLAFSS